MFQSSRLSSIGSPARIGSRASGSRPKAASFSNQAWSASVSAGETLLNGISKKQAMAPKLEPRAPSLREL
ncbi:MAG: hypothetical protein CMJ64_21155 [Planctomycetaceae bacterium]|nr:hypothetical protein [Planctomycetaceae bacterium]